MAKGFTLVELSIVLIIIGLIVGGVVGGQSLMRSATLNKVVSDFLMYEVAYRTFKMQYDVKPGDMTDAREYWTNTVDNGNGDGIINYGERAFAWEHLSRAELIADDLDGKGYANTVNALGLNKPHGAIEGSGLMLSAWDTTLNSYHGQKVNCVDEPVQETLVFGREFRWGQEFGTILGSGDTRAIDIKMDDGDAVAGKLRGMPSRGDCQYGCHQYSNSHHYDLDRGGDICILIYQLE